MDSNMTFEQFLNSKGLTKQEAIDKYKSLDKNQIKKDVADMLTTTTEHLENLQFIKQMEYFETIGEWKNEKYETPEE